jgi:tRNA A22 N-methylase
MAFVKNRPYTSDMIDDIRIADLLENGQINGVGQKQVIQLIADFRENFKRQILPAVKRQVNIRAGIIIALGARAVEHGLF